MARTVFTVRTEVRRIPEAYLQMIRLKRSGKTFSTKKDYVRRDKHRKNWMEEA